MTQPRLIFPTRMKRFSQILLLLLTLTLACRKDTDTTTVVVNSPLPEEHVESTLVGQVLDEFGTPIPNALVTAGKYETTTDAFGIYVFKRKLLNKNGQFLHASKPGFISSGEFSFQRLGSTAFARIILFEDKQQTTFSSQQGVSLSSGGMKVEIPENAVADLSGKPYNGQVRIFYRYLDPTNPVVQQAYPGDNRALTLDAEPNLAQPFGLVSVTLQTLTGQPLNLLPGKKAKLTLPLQSPQGQNAPSQLSICSFDELSGYWKEEGSATLSGSAYTAEVGHFTVWSAMKLTNFVLLHGQLFSDINLPVGACKVLVNNALVNGITLYTDELGRFTGLVPSGTPLKLWFYDDCDNPLDVLDIGSLDNEKDLGPIKLVFPNGVMTVKGKLTDCQGQPVEDGFATIQIEGKMTAVAKADVDGNFVFRRSNCIAGSEIRITGFDQGTLAESKTLILPSGSSEVDAGTLVICNAVSEYLVVDYNGKSFTYIGDFQVDVQEGTIHILADSNLVDLDWAEQPGGPLVQDMQNLHFRFKDPKSKEVQEVACDFCPLCACSSDHKIYFDHSPEVPVGQFIEGTLKGVYVDPGSSLVLNYGIQFQLKRDQ